MLKTDSKKLETRDFISVGIFSLIYSVVAFVIGGVAQMTPVTFPFMPMIVALFTGTVFMLYVAKIPKKGALSIEIPARLWYNAFYRRCAVGFEANCVQAVCLLFHPLVRAA